MKDSYSENCLKIIKIKLNEFFSQLPDWEKCYEWVRIIHLTMAPTHGTFPSFFEMDKTAGAYSLHIYDYLRQIQR